MTEVGRRVVVEQVRSDDLPVAALHVVDHPLEVPHHYALVDEDAGQRSRFPVPRLGP